MYLKKMYKYPDQAAKDACMDIRAAARQQCNTLRAETEARCEAIRAAAEAQCCENGCEIDHINVLRAKDKQNFSETFIMDSLWYGFLSIDKANVMTLKTVPILKYRILRRPGYYCCHCHAPMYDGPMALAHIQAVHAGAASPDKGNPAGYRKDNFYACELVKEGSNHD